MTSSFVQPNQPNTYRNPNLHHNMPNNNLKLILICTLAPKFKPSPEKLMITLWSVDQTSQNILTFS